MKKINLTDIEGVKLGHAQDYNGGTGCSVVICEEGATAGVDVRGGAPATRETDLLNPINLVEKIHAVMLSGGSAFGLDAASGAMAYLEENNIGFDVQVTKVPIVCGAALFDLIVGDHKIRPDKAMGYKACEVATISEKREGSVGAGTGACIGKLFGVDRAMKGGIGIFGLQIGELKVASIVAVNCLGDVIDSETNEVVAGLLDESKEKMIDTEEMMYQQYNKKSNVFAGNTTLGVVVTNGKFTKAQMTKIASMAHNGYAQSMKPAHSMFDGDTIFALATNQIDADLNVVGSLASKTVAKAVCRGVREAEGMYGLKSYTDFSDVAKR